MGQGEVLELLERTSGKFSAGEIAKFLGANQKEVSKDLNKLLQYDEIKTQEIPTKEAMEKYNCRRRMKIYFCK